MAPPNSHSSAADRAASDASTTATADDAGFPSSLSGLVAVVRERVADRILHNAGGTLFLQVANAVLGFVASIVLARLLGEAGFGVYSYAWSWTALLAIPATLGLDKLLVREVAALSDQGDWSRLRGLLRRSLQAVAVGASALALGAGLVAWWTTDDPTTLHALWIALALLPLVALLYTRQAILQGLEHVALGHAPHMLVRPLLLLVFVGALWLVLDDVTAPWALVGHGVAIVVALAAGWGFMRKRLPGEVDRAHPSYATDRWARSAIPLMLIGAMYIVNSKADIVLLGILGTNAQVGIYTAAVKGATLVLFVLMALNKTLSPRFSRLWTAGDHARLEHTARWGARVIFALTLPIVVGLVALGHYYLLLFGEGFTDGWTALAILCGGQLLNASAGSVGFLLMMSDHERVAARNVGISAAVNVGLNLVLIPRFGMEGAAAATATSILLVNVLQTVAVWRTLRINPMPLGPRLQRKE